MPNYGRPQIKRSAKEYASRSTGRRKEAYSVFCKKLTRREAHLSISARSTSRKILEKILLKEISGQQT
jgi:hypothetical protein